MKDKKLLELLENYFSFNEKEEIKDYIFSNFEKISKNDLKNIILSLLDKNIFFYADIKHYQEIIKNIDNKNWLDDESNYM